MFLILEGNTRPTKISIIIAVVNSVIILLIIFHKISSKINFKNLFIYGFTGSVIFFVTEAENASLSTAKAEPAGSACLSQREITPGVRGSGHLPSSLIVRGIRLFPHVE